jgi:DNA polymerase-3 subunit delta
VDELVPEADRAFGLETVNGKVGTVEEAIQAVGRCIESLRTPGFLAGRKVVWFQDVSFLRDTVVGKSKDVKEALGRLADVIRRGAPAGNVLVISADAVNGNSAMFRACDTHGTACEVAAVDRSKDGQIQEHAKRMAVQAFKDLGLSASGEVCREIAERVGGDTRLIFAEVEKLAVALRGRKTVEMADVEAFVAASRERPWWDLADAFGSRDLPKALRVLRQMLFQGETAVGLLIQLEGKIRELMVYREALTRGWVRGTWQAVPEWVNDLLAKRFSSDPRRTWDFLVRKAAVHAANFTAEELHACLRAVLETHERMVSGKSVPDGLALELLLLRITAVRITA